MSKVNAGAGTVAVAESAVAVEVGELGEWLLVGWVLGVEESLWLEFITLWVSGFFTGDEAALKLALGIFIRSSFACTY